MAHASEVLIIGSGFGASVAALRFAQAGKKVTILERGGWITRESFEADDDMFWHPKSGRFGMNEFKPRGRHIIPWLGAGVGGGSHVYAGTLKRREFFHDFPGTITVEEMTPYYERAERMMDAKKYPDYPPYSTLPSYCIFRKAEVQLRKDRPDLVEEQGQILLAISYAPKNGTPGATFINKYGAQQRYSDPTEQKILGGEIDVKNTLDKNYLFEAQKLGVDIIPYAEVTKIAGNKTDGYTITYKDLKSESIQTFQIQTEILVLGAGSIGSTQLLLQCRDVYKTLPRLSDKLGSTYRTNGDHVTFLIPKKGFALSWLGVLGASIATLAGAWSIAAVGGVVYVAGWIASGKKAQPDKGTTNSDYIRFKGEDGEVQGAYIEGGRYPTPIKAIASMLWSLTGNFRPKSYSTISALVNWMGKYIPVFELIERSWPIAMLMMGRDKAVGTFSLDKNNEATITYPIDDNKAYVAYLNKLGRLFAKRAKSYYIPNSIAEILKIVEIPHNIGGVQMGETRDSGVVDTYGRVFAYNNFLVLDGSILPTSLGPNPVNTILAFSERGMDKALEQLQQEGHISAEEKF